MKTFDIEEKDLRLMREEGAGIDLSVSEARGLFDILPDETEALSDALDQAQGAVHSSSRDVSYVVIRIKH